MEWATILDEFQTQGFHLQPLNPIKQGKEAQVWLVQNLEGGEVALKVYFDNQDTSFNRYFDYMRGARISDKYRKAVARKNKQGRKFVQESRVLREFNILTKIYNLGGAVPQPLAFANKCLLMQYIGDDQAAPRLADINLTPAEAKQCFQEILKTMEIFLEIGIVHADLSAFNILFHQNRPWIIDFPQSPDIRTNPNGEQMLVRDFENVCKYFQKYIPIPNKDQILLDFCDKLRQKQNFQTLL